MPLLYVVCMLMSCIVTAKGRLSQGKALIESQVKNMCRRLVRPYHWSDLSETQDSEYFSEIMKAENNSKKIHVSTL